jgi:hypothetical protein
MKHWIVPGLEAKRDAALALLQNLLDCYQKPPSFSSRPESRKSLEAMLSSERKLKELCQKKSKTSSGSPMATKNGSDSGADVFDIDSVCENLLSNFQALYEVSFRIMNRDDWPNKP